jgi:RNA polymerase sigma-70 factor (ECF subfamily)
MSDVFRDGIVELIPAARAYATVLTRHKGDADDLVQDTLMRAWRFRDGFAAGTNLKAWLFKILRNEFVALIYARRNLVQDVDGRYAARLVSAADQDWRLAYSELLDGLDQLTPDTREALLLVAATGLTCEEAAQVCGCAVGTIKSRVSRARQRLAELVDVDLPLAQDRQGRRPVPARQWLSFRTGTARAGRPACRVRRW